MNEESSTKDKNEHEGKKIQCIFFLRVPSWIISFLCLLCVQFLSDSAQGQDLRVFESAHYRIHTDLEDDLSDDLARRMDAMYDEYARRLAGFSQPADSGPLEAYLVHTQEKYLHLAGITLAGTGGSFNAGRHLLAAFLDGQGRDALRRTLQHEAFHQFAAAVIGRNIPVWLNEGLAQVFEEGIWTGDGFLLGQVPPRRIRQLQRDIEQGTLIDFGHLLTMSSPEWAIGWRDPTVSATEYNQAWAATHFLVYATDDRGALKYRARLIEMLKSLAAGMNGDAAFRTAFSDNVDGFRDRFLEYAATLRPTPQATMIENQGVLADMLIEMRHQGRTFDTIDEFRNLCIRQRWRVHYIRAGLQWESAMDPSVYFRSPSGAELSADQLHFEISGSRPMQDLVCRCDGLPALRTRFCDDADGKIEHETIVDWR